MVHLPGSALLERKCPFTILALPKAFLDVSPLNAAILNLQFLASGIAPLLRKMWSRSWSFCPAQNGGGSALSKTGSATIITRVVSAEAQLVSTSVTVNFN